MGAGLHFCATRDWQRELGRVLPSAPPAGLLSDLEVSLERVGQLLLLLVLCHLS